MKRTLVIIMSFMLAVGLSACGQDAESTGGLEQQMEVSEAENSESEQPGEEDTENDESEQQGEEAETENDESEQLIEDAEISGECGDHLIWYYKNEVLYISGTGEMFDYDYYGESNEMDGSIDIYGTSAPWDNLCARIEEVVIDEGVTSIGDWSFYGCTSLTEITIPDSVTSISYGAFAGCSSLREITILESVTGIVEDDFLGINENIFDSCSDLTVYYSGNALDEYINSYQDVWDSNHITWIKQ